jgi:hypothetical protein
VEGDATREVAISGVAASLKKNAGAPGRSRIGVYLEPGMSAYAFTFG